MIRRIERFYFHNLKYVTLARESPSLIIAVSNFISYISKFKLEGVDAAVHLSSTVAVTCFYEISI